MIQQSDAVVQDRKFADHSLTGSGYTYFVRHDDMIKIGYSGSPKERIKSIQTAIPKLLEIMAVVPSAIVDEPTAHQKFAHLRMSGEWFRAAPDLLEFIAQVKNEADNASKGPYPTMRATELSDEIDRCLRALAILRRKQPIERRALINDLIGQLKNLPANPVAMRPLIRATVQQIEQALRAAAPPASPPATGNL